MLPYVALTRDSAKNIMWPILLEVNERYQLGARPVESSLEMIMPNKSVVKLFGADMKNFIQRLRGIKTPFGAIDESQSFRGHIEELVDDILTPAISDYPDGQLALTGTPGPVPKGYFHDVCKGGGGFRVHKWTVYQNPYMPNIRQFVDDLKIKKGWDENNPTYRREWLGQWVADTDALVYKFNEHTNTARELPRATQWTYVIGVDLGYSPDPTAFVIGAYNEFDPHLYIIDTFKQTQMIISDVAERIRYYQKQFPNAYIVMDAADKQAVEEMKQRYGLPIEAAEKHGKAGFIELMNSDLKKGVIKVLDGYGEALIEEWQNLIWDTESERRIEDSRYANHLADGALYLWRYCFNYLWKDRPQITDPHSETAVDEFWDREAERIEREREENQQNDFDY